MRARYISNYSMYTDPKSTLFQQRAVFLCGYQDCDIVCDILYYPESDSIIIQYGQQISETYVLPVPLLRGMTDSELWKHEYRVPLLVSLQCLYKANALQDAIYPLTIYDFVPESALRLSCEPNPLLVC